MVSSAPLRARFDQCYRRARSFDIEAADPNMPAVDAFVPGPASPSPGPSFETEAVPRNRQLPSYLRESTSPGQEEEDVDKTQFMPALVLGPALPFEGSTSPAKLAELKRHAASADPPTPAATDEPPEETLEIRSPLLQESAGTGTFRDAISPIAVPVLTIEQYAQFQAKVRVLGESHEPTWREFQISSASVRDALAARFAAYFAREPQAKEDFAKRVEQLVLKARRHTIKLGEK